MSYIYSNCIFSKLFSQQTAVIHLYIAPKTLIDHNKTLFLTSFLHHDVTWLITFYIQNLIMIYTTFNLILKALFTTLSLE